MKKLVVILIAILHRAFECFSTSCSVVTFAETFKTGIVFSHKCNPFINRLFLKFTTSPDGMVVVGCVDHPAWLLLCACGVVIVIAIVGARISKEDCTFFSGCRCT